MVPPRRSTKRQATRIEYRAAQVGRPPIEVRSSARRTKTASAWWDGPTLVVALPVRVRGDEREELIETLLVRSNKRRPAAQASENELLERARHLSRRYALNVDPASVSFVSNQQKRWGSCSVVSRTIRISDRLRDVPGWVLDAVLVHELAHLAHPDHSAAFHELANRCPDQREASRFLDGFQLGLETARAGDSSPDNT